MKQTSLNTIIWILLLLLTIAGYIIAEFSAFNNGLFAVILILAATAIKFLSVGYQFLDLKEAHIAWRLLFTGFILLFLFVIFFLSTRPGIL